MSYLSGREAQALHRALRSAFSASSMKQMVRFELDSGEVTYGMFENLSIGHHSPYGFDSFEAVSP